MTSDSKPGEGPKELRESLILEDLSSQNKTGTFATYFNMFKIFVGIGILASPHAFSQSGILLGSLALAIIAALNIYTIFIMRDTKTACGS